MISILIILEIAATAAWCYLFLKKEEKFIEFENQIIKKIIRK